MISPAKEAVSVQLNKVKFSIDGSYMRIENFKHDARGAKFSKVWDEYAMGTAMFDVYAWHGDSSSGVPYCVNKAKSVFGKQGGCHSFNNRCWLWSFSSPVLHSHMFMAITSRGITWECPVDSDPNEIAILFKWCIDEMSKRNS